MCIINWSAAPDLSRLFLCAVYPRRPRSAPFLGALFLVSVSKTELSLEYTQWIGMLSWYISCGILVFEKYISSPPPPPMLYWKYSYLRILWARIFWSRWSNTAEVINSNITTSWQIWSCPIEFDHLIIPPLRKERVDGIKIKLTDGQTEAGQKVVRKAHLK